MDIRGRIAGVATAADPRTSPPAVDAVDRSRSPERQRLVPRRARRTSKVVPAPAAGRRRALRRGSLTGGDQRAPRDRARDRLGDDDPGDGRAAAPHGGRGMTSASEQWIASALQRAADRIPLPPESRWVPARRSGSHLSTIVIGVAVL